MGGAKMINVYMCVEQPQLSEQLGSDFRRIAHIQGIDLSVKSFLSGEKIIQEFEQDKNILDFVCLDIMIGKDSGLEVAKTMRKMGYTGEIIFFANNKKMVLASFEVQPLGYVLKDKASYARFREVALKRMEEINRQPKESLVCAKKGWIKRIPLRDIIYIEVQGRMSIIHYGQETFEILLSLKELAMKLENKGFVRINRSFLVNGNYLFHKEGRKKIGKKEFFGGGGIIYQ